MILCAGLGFAVQHFAGWQPAVMVGVFAGLLLAPLVPNKSGCGSARDGQ